MARHEMNALVRTRVQNKTHRLIASRYPTVGVFDDLTTDPDELEAAFLLESITNDRIAAITRRLPLLPESEIVRGPGATMVMAAFLHADATGGRFTDGRLGAWYAALDVATAIDETVYHDTRRLRLSDGGFPNSIQMRELVANIDCSLVDIRGQQASRPELYLPDDYTASRAFGVGLRWPANGVGENGIVFDSVRHAGGTNVCLYGPTLVPLPVLQADHYEYRWDRSGAVTVLKLTNITANHH
jgi:RES domain